MSGFRDFNTPALTPKTKTLSSSLDEDDWETEPAPTEPRTQNPNWRETHEPEWLPNKNQGAPQKLKSPFLSQEGELEKAPGVTVSSGSDWRDEKPVDWLAEQRKGGNLQKSNPTLGSSTFNQQSNPSLTTSGLAPTKSNPALTPSGPSPTKSNPSLAKPAAAPLPTHISASRGALNTGVQYDSTQFKSTGLDAQALASKYPVFTASEISAFHQQFSTLTDKEAKNLLHVSDVGTLATKAGVSGHDLTAKLAQLNIENRLDFDTFLKAVSQVRKEKGATTLRDDKKIVLHGHLENTTHTINVDEKESFTIHINQQLGNDKDIKHRLPIDPASMQLFTECKDGLILAKLINDAVPGTIDERVLNAGKKLNTFHITENNNVVVNSAKAIGCSVVNIGSQDIMEGREHLILGLIWQIIKIGLQANIDIKVHPELFRLLEPGESMEDFLKLPAEQILLRWFNYHLKKANHHRVVKNFSSDIKDGENYTVLLNQLAPNLCSRSPLQTADLYDRAEQILQNAEKLGCRKYLSPKTLVEGNPKLNFAFVAHLFNTHPGLEKLSDAEMAHLDEWLFGSEGDREARAFALWLNSLGVDPFVNNLFDDLRVHFF